MEESLGGSFVVHDTPHYGVEQRILSEKYRLTGAGPQQPPPGEAQYFLALLGAAE